MKQKQLKHYLIRFKRNALSFFNKGQIGHCLGAAGAIEAIFTIKALNEGIIPPTINIENQDPECDLDYVANVARKAN